MKVFKSDLKTAKVYHFRRDCQQLNAARRRVTPVLTEIEKEEAERIGLRQCWSCTP